MATVTISNFSGGIIDSYLAAPPNTSKELHNFLLGDDGKPTVRPAWTVFGTRVTVSNSNRISGIYIGSSPYNYPVFFRGNAACRLNADDTLSEITGPAANVAIPNKTGNGFESCVVWNKQLVYCGDASTCLPHRIYCSSTTEPYTFTALTLGLPALASSPTVTAGAAGSNTYIYAFHYFYEFTDADGTTYQESGPITFVTLSSAAAPNSNTVPITDIPVLANTSSTNYVVSTSMKVRVYRTVAFGSTFYLLGTVNNGTTTYNDSAADTTIDDAEVLYTDGGLLDYNPPIAGTKYVTEANDFFWYATDRKLYHSIQGAPGACPDEYHTELAQKAAGLGSILSFPILFCDRSVYRVEGVFDEFGDGGFELKEISKTAGCISHRSIVPVPGGLAWAGNGGFYFTDGYQVQKITVHLNQRYETWKNARIVGAFDSTKNLIIWTVNSSANSAVNPNDNLAVCHVNFGISPTSSFTTLGSENNIFPNTVAFSDALDVSDDFRGKIVIGSAAGYVHYFDDNAYCDPRVDTDVEASNWNKKTIIYRYESVGMDLGTDAVRAYLQHLTYELNNFTDVACKFESRRDDGGPWASLSEIRKDGALLWDISEETWDNVNEEDSDDISHDFDSQSIIEGIRHFPRGTLRSTRRQVALTNSKTWVAKSDTLGTVTTDTNTKYITLNTGTSAWPDDCEEFEITFASDSYTYGYTVRNRISDTVIEVIDPYDDLPSGSTLEWQMRGYRKQERLSLLSYTIHFDDDGKTQEPSRGSSEYVNS